MSCPSVVVLHIQMYIWYYVYKVLNYGQSFQSSEKKNNTRHFNIVYLFKIKIQTNSLLSSMISRNLINFLALVSNNIWAYLYLLLLDSLFEIEIDIWYWYRVSNLLNNHFWMGKFLKESALLLGWDSK